MLPFLEQEFGFLDKRLRILYQTTLPKIRVYQSNYPLLSWLPHTFVGLKQRSNVDGLGAPDVPVDSPIEGKLQASSV